MKTIITFFACSIFSAGIFAQSAESVTINFKGITSTTKNYQVKINETSYYSNDNRGSSIVKISTLPVGRHQLTVYGLQSGNPRYNNAKNPLVYSQVFELRQGYNMEITVRPNGRVLFGEKALSNTTGVAIVKAPMTVTKFNALAQSVKSKFSQALKGEVINEAFADTSNYFSTAQVKQLLNLVSNESDRLDLAMLSLRAITNTADLQEINTVFKVKSNVDEFNNFLISKGYTVNDNSLSSRKAMTDANFNLVLQNVKSKWSQSLKGEAVSDAFRKPNNYFSTSQVRQLLIQINSETDKVDLAKIAYPTLIDSANFLQVYSLFNNQTSKDELNDYLRTQGWKFAGDVTVKSVMSDADFNTLLQNVRNKWSQAQKGETINEAFRNNLNHFSTSQVKQLITVITDEGDKLELAKMSYPLIADTLNFTQLYTLFPSQSSKDALNAFLRDRGWQISTDISGNLKTPMSETDFNQLVQNIKGNLLQILKIASLKNVLRDPNNYFTSNQVYQLISLVNAEESRLEVSKLSYRSVVDRSNFTQVYNLFSIQANKDNLAKYVAEYRE